MVEIPGQQLVKRLAGYYTDSRAAYIALSPKKLAAGDHVVPAIARELQEKGEIPPGEIKGVKRVR